MSTTPTALPQSAPADLSGLTGAGSGLGTSAPDVGSPAPIDTNAPQAPAAPAANPNAINPAVAPPAPPAAPPPHAKLLAMVQGLSIGLSAAGAAISTHGREGGAPMVQEYYQKQAAAKQQAAAAQQALKDAQVRNALMTAQTNQANSQNFLLNATLPDDVAKSHMSVQEAQTKLGGEEFNLFANTGMSPQQIAALTQGGPVDGKTFGILQANAQQQYRLASQLLPAGNPALVALKQQLDTPSANPASLIMTTKRLAQEVQGQKDITDDKIKSAQAAATAPFGDKAAMVNDAILRRMQVNNPQIKALPAGYAMTANSTPADLDRVDKLLLPTEQAEATKANREVVNGMREQMLDIAKGAKIPGDETKQGAEYLATLPVGLQGTIKEIGEGRGAPLPSGSRSPAAQTISGALNRAYPDYDATKYPGYLKARTAFTSGPEAKGINAINTVETHLARMYDHATAPGTSGGITGRITGFFGDKDVRALDIDRTAVSTELSKAYAAGQISEGEVKDWEAKLDFRTPGMTTGKLVNNLKEIDALLEGKQKAYEQQWSTAAPSSSIVSPVPIISTDASAARAKIQERAQPSAHNVGDRVTLKNGQQVVIKSIDPATGNITF